MKKIILISLLFISQISFSQDLASLYDSISQKSGADIAKKISNIEKTLSDKLNKSNTSKITIGVYPMRNSRNEYTKISKKLTTKIITTVQRKLNSRTGIKNFDDINFVIYEKNKNYDFKMSFNYKLATNNFIIENIKFQTQKSTTPISQSNITVENIDLLEQINYATVCDNIDQLSRALVIQYSKHRNLKNVKLTNFVYEDDKVPTKFSDRLSSYLIGDFTNIGITVKRHQATRSLESTARYIVGGSYCIEGDKLKITSTLSEPEKNIILASATAYILVKYLKDNNISYKTKNKKEFNNRQKKLEETNVENDFNIDVWTNKGNENPIFKNGDILDIYIIAEVECYVRVIDIFADGTAVLLESNYKIDKSKVNEKISVLENIGCSPPFGAETIIVLAQNTPFPQLNIQKYKNFKIITDDLKTIRGFGSDYKASKYINVVTMEK